MNLNRKTVEEPFSGFQKILEAAKNFGRKGNVSYEKFITAVKDGSLGKEIQKTTETNPLSPFEPFPGFRALIERLLRNSALRS